jgi:hypothetical protein
MGASAGTTIGTMFDLRSLISAACAGKMRLIKIKTELIGLNSKNCVMFFILRMNNQVEHIHKTGASKEAVKAGRWLSGEEKSEVLSDKYELIGDTSNTTETVFTPSAIHLPDNLDDAHQQIKSLNQLVDEFSIGCKSLTAILGRQGIAKIKGILLHHRYITRLINQKGNTIGWELTSKGVAARIGTHMSSPNTKRQNIRFHSNIKELVQKLNNL